MNNLKSLELQRLIKELQFVESDYLYQSEVIRQSDRFFLESVDSLLESNPDLKKIWDDKQSNKEQIDVTNVSIEFQQKKPTIEPKVKKIYREIVKSTHPDKIKNSKLNELYLEATSAYESNDIITLYRVCSDLMIDLTFEEKEIQSIRDRINQIKNQIQFLESTYTFKWLKSTNDDKNRVVLNFIKNRLK